MLDISSRPLLFECRERLIEASAWKVCPANYFPYSALEARRYALARNTAIE